MDSLEVKRMEQTIINYINTVMLPAEVKLLVLERISGQVKCAADDEIRAALENEKKEVENE